MNPSVALALGLILIWAVANKRAAAIWQAATNAKASDQNTTQPSPGHTHTRVPGLSAGTLS